MHIRHYSSDYFKEMIPSNICRHDNSGYLDVEFTQMVDEIGFGKVSWTKSKRYDNNLENISIVISNAQESCDELKSFVNAFENVFKIRCQANVYGSPSYSSAFPVHFDWMDVFILQMEGSKVWTLYEPIIMYPRPSMRFAITNTTQLRILDTVKLTTGDVLYIPSGIIHQAKATNSFSCHVTIGLETTELGSWESLLIDFILKRLDNDGLVETSNEIVSMIQTNIVDGIVWGHIFLMIILQVGTQINHYRKAVPFLTYSKDKLLNEFENIIHTLQNYGNLTRCFEISTQTFLLFHDSLRETFLLHKELFVSTLFHHEMFEKIGQIKNYLHVHSEFILDQFHDVLINHFSRVL